ncbi:hypothetical protein F8S09_03775 [Deinococcus sp. SDU3-2]|uniref:Uncharacterized protein n=1 Tax=Deinococcus terrestris TaxID=2651870 RepID=A0A7X1TR06_9DEIO|nr:hypothetical protein [Deinococcus terrestris]MPY65817.1 hypothetical protein [Deinococcus terrestris]
MTRHWDTSPLAPARWPQVAEAAVGVLSGAGATEVTTLHGWTESAFGGSPVFGALQWAEVRCPVSELLPLLRGRQALGFTLGRDDWWWRGLVPETGQAFELLFCHEGDLHLTTQDDALAERLGSGLAALGTRLNPRKLAP